MTKEREQLREAIKDYTEALANMHRAENTLARAHEMMDTLLSNRSCFDALDSEIATARADLIRQALDCEDNRHLLVAEPEGFAAAKVSRDNLDQQIAGVNDLLAVLEEKLANARGHAEECDYALELAREAVFGQEAEALAQDFLQRLMEVRRMSLELRFMSLRQMRKSPDALSVTGSQLYGDGGMRKISMPRLVADAVHEDVMGDYDRRGGLKLRDDVGRAVADWWARLRIDPLATFDAEKLLEAYPHSPIVVMERASW
jgi:hypothetical protein